MAYRAVLVDIETSHVVNVVMMPADSEDEFSAPEGTRVERVDYDSPLAPGWTWSDTGDHQPPAEAE